MDFLNSMKPHGKVFHCTEVDGESITIEYRKMKFKVNSSLYRPVEEPKFKVGDILVVQGKKSRRWYKNSDLRKINA